MKHKVRNTLGAIVLSSVVGLGLAGCGKQEQPIRASAYWIGPQVTEYQENSGDGKIDNIKVTYCSQFFAGPRWHYRSPTERELKDSEKILASKNIFEEQ